MQQQTEWPGADVVLNITTSADRADAEAHTLSTASNETYQLASDIGAQGEHDVMLQSHANPELKANYHSMRLKRDADAGSFNYCQLNMT